MPKGRPKGTPKTGGRKPGTPNKVHANVRECIAHFAEQNVHMLEIWLRETAEGNPELGVKPDPGKAADLYLRAIEYHIPKLSRSEVTGKDGDPMQVATTIRLIGV